MTVLEAYDAVLIEVNKVSAPTFLVGDFNYFLGKALSKTVEEVYSAFEANQLTTDALNELITTKEYSGVEAPQLDSQVDLPDDYLHIINLIADNSNLVHSCNNVNKIVSVKKLPYNIGDIYSNAYFKPSANRPYYQMRGNKLCFINGDNQISKLTLYYISRPSFIDLTEDDLSSSVDNTQKLQLPEFMAYELITRLTNLILENSTDARIQTFAPINQ